MFRALRAVMVVSLIVTVSLLSLDIGHGRMPEICIVFDVSGRGDLGINDMAAFGGQNVAIANGLNLIEVQSNSAANYVPNLNTLSQRGSCVLIAAVGFLLTDAVIQVAASFPNQKYAIVDGVVPNTDNVISVVFREEDGSALVGALAALVNKRFVSGGSAGGVGIVLGIEIPVLWKIECGFKAGVRWVDNGQDNSVFDLGNTPGNKSTPIPFVYTGSFSDPALGHSAAEAQLAQGVQVIYNAAGGTGLGMIAAVANAGRALGHEAGPPFAIGAESDQDYLEGGGFVLASMMKRVDRGIEMVVQSVVEGNFQGGLISLGLSESGISISTEGDFDTFVQIGINAGFITRGVVNANFARFLEQRSLFVDEFETISTLQDLIEDGIISVPSALDQETIDTCRAAYD